MARRAGWNLNIQAHQGELLIQHGGRSLGDEDRPAGQAGWVKDESSQPTDVPRPLCELEHGWVMDVLGLNRGPIQELHEADAIPDGRRQ
jgi:hypothetical protein